MIQSFVNQDTSDIYEGVDSKRSRKLCPAKLLGTTQRKLDMLDAAITLEDLRIPPGNRLESLVGSRAGQHSIRINQQYRICFVWTSSGPADVEIVDYH